MSGTWTLTETCSTSQDEQPALLPEQELVERLKRQEEGAVRILYQTYAPKLLLRLSGLTGNLQLAEDCLQQVFIDALRSIERFRGESSLATWLHRIATRVAYKQFHKQRRMATVMEQFFQDFRTTPKETKRLSEALLLEQETRQLVWDVLERLSARKRMAILLCDIEGHSLEEAAEQMEVPVGTVSSRLCHGRKEFQKRFAMELKRRGLSTEDLFHEQ